MRRLLIAVALAAVSTAAATAAPPPAGGKMKACAAKWRGMSAAEKGRYDARAKTMKSKKGNAMSGYNAFTAECMKG